MTLYAVVTHWRCMDCGTWSEVEVASCPGCAHGRGELRFGGLDTVIRAGEFHGAGSLEVRALLVDVGRQEVKRERPSLPPSVDQRDHWTVRWRPRKAGEVEW